MVSMYSIQSAEKPTYAYKTSRKHKKIKQQFSLLNGELTSFAERALLEFDLFHSGRKSPVEKRTAHTKRNKGLSISDRRYTAAPMVHFLLFTVTFWRFIVQRDGLGIGQRIFNPPRVSLTANCLLCAKRIQIANLFSLVAYRTFLYVVTRAIGCATIG